MSWKNQASFSTVWIPQARDHSVGKPAPATVVAEGLWRLSISRRLLEFGLTPDTVSNPRHGGAARVRNNSATAHTARQALAFRQTASGQLDSRIDGGVDLVLYGPIASPTNCHDSFLSLAACQGGAHQFSWMVTGAADRRPAKLAEAAWSGARHRTGWKRSERLVRPCFLVYSISRYWEPRSEAGGPRK